MTAVVERDSAGRLQPGHKALGGGRPRGIDFRRQVAERLERDGGDVGDVVYSLFQSLVASAMLGDTKAATFLIERLCGPADHAKRITVELEPDDSGRMGPIMPSNPQAFAERCATVVRELRLLQ